MPELICVTGNLEKFSIAKRAFTKQGITLKQVVADIDEIQGEDPMQILTDKARKAFAIVKQPLLVTDDSWEIPALNGFPGAYMKSVNHWFEPEDFLVLMSEKNDRTIFLDQRIAYIDGDEMVTFEKRLEGVFVVEPRGEIGPPIMHVVELEGDDGLTISELFDKGLAEGLGADRDAWVDAAKWYAGKIKEG